MMRGGHVRKCSNHPAVGGVTASGAGSPSCIYRCGAGPEDASISSDAAWWWKSGSGTLQSSRFPFYPKIAHRLRGSPNGKACQPNGIIHGIK